jgi:hypothetical protein
MYVMPIGISTHGYAMLALPQCGVMTLYLNFLHAQPFQQDLYARHMEHLTLCGDSHFVGRLDDFLVLWLH